MQMNKSNVITLEPGDTVHWDTTPGGLSFGRVISDVRGVIETGGRIIVDDHARLTLSVV